MSRQRLHGAFGRVVLTAAIVGLSIGSVSRPECCQAATIAAADELSAEKSCCSDSAPALQGTGHTGCCGSLAHVGTIPSSNLPCHCQLKPRDSEPYVTATRPLVALDHAAPASLAIDSEPVMQRTQLITSVFDAAPPERPVRVLYGVWRN